MADLLAENRVAISPMIRLELLGGTNSTGEFDRLKSRLSALHEIPADEANWELATRLSFDLRQKGKAIPYTDVLIAAAAMVGGCLLLHADRHVDLIAEATRHKWAHEEVKLLKLYKSLGSERGQGEGVDG